MGISRGSEVGEVHVCKAFPKGIPDEIAFGDDLHLEPRDGDHGIQFKPREIGGEVAPVLTDEDDAILDAIHFGSAKKKRPAI